MNPRLEALLKIAQYYTPSETVTIGAGQTQQIEFNGLNSERYGINRILAGGSGLNKITCSLSVDNGRKNVIPPIQLQTLQKLFLLRSIEGAIIIEKGAKAVIELTNNDTVAHTINLELIGFDAAHLKQKIDAFQKRNLPFPKPEFLTMQTTVPAGVTRFRASIVMPTFETRLYRMAMSSEDDSNLLVSISQDNSRIKNDVFISQINEEFQNMRIILPRTLKAKEPFEIFLTNQSINDIVTSFIGETYRI